MSKHFQCKFLRLSSDSRCIWRLFPCLKGEEENEKKLKSKWLLEKVEVKKGLPQDISQKKQKRKAIY